MLTDNGRQYASWRGKTKFQKELEKDHVHHIRSAPHHPMTLGKIERFWQTSEGGVPETGPVRDIRGGAGTHRLLGEVLQPQAAAPGAGRDVPGDRFFSIQKEMQAAIERGMAANVEELALRGKPVKPFYMVGRMGDKSVVIETDKKRMSVLVDGQELSSGQAMTYEVKEGVAHECAKGSQHELTGQSRTAKG